MLISFNFFVRHENKKGKLDCSKIAREIIISRLQEAVLISVKFLSENASKSKTDFVSSEKEIKIEFSWAMRRRKKTSII